MHRAFRSVDVLQPLADILQTHPTRSSNSRQTESRQNSSGGSFSMVTAKMVPFALRLDENKASIAPSGNAMPHRVLHQRLKDEARDQCVGYSRINIPVHR
jgi:hypothetical protein